MASYMRVPPLTSQEPGSSATKSGQLTIPMAVLPLDDSTRTGGYCRALVLVMPMRVAVVGENDTRPVSSRAVLMNLKTSLACSMELQRTQKELSTRNMEIITRGVRHSP